MGLHYRIRNLLVVIAVLVLFPLLVINTSLAQEQFTVVNMTTPFGTSAYSAGIALEKVFQEAGSWVRWQVNPTPGAIEGIDRDVWAGVALGVFRAPQNLRPDVVQEIIRVRHKYREKLGQYHADLKFFPENPYPAGVPEAYIVPTVKQAMHNLGLPLPPGVR